MIDNIYDKIIHPQNLYRAAYAAARAKKGSGDVAAFFFQMEREVARLYWELRSGKYRHGPYTVFRIYEPKPRDISKALFRDRVVHHAVHDMIEPFIDKKFIFDSYACRRGKGTHVALDRAQSFLKAGNYCMHGDIRKYFPSIDHAILKGLLRRYIADPKLLFLLDHIIDTARDEVGLPIGNLTSQFFANLYLHELDHYVKHTLGCRYYIRYMDDVLLFHKDHAVLEGWRLQIRDMLASRLRLRLHDDKTQIFSVREGVTFLGFRLSRGRCRVCARGMKRLRARLKMFRYLAGQEKITGEEITASVLCWSAHSRYADTSRLRAVLARETSGWNEDASAALS